MEHQVTQVKTLRGGASKQVQPDEKPQHYSDHSTQCQYRPNCGQSRGTAFSIRPRIGRDVLKVKSVSRDRVLTLVFLNCNPLL